ncbi:hypothetical protein K7W42_17850 [Deinococcus sp. HMF7604]|uniref:hypothetical protein n=1 Tax=Deinococcus betulae TaxID=2873312 RepID=UPI001CC90CAB|nr:hypothetical protein [Deinococcus betulae]MBZ9752708.1 hypothetical protein [Deinococcus betulae]
MNSERQLDNVGRSVSLLRDAFRAAIGRLMQDGGQLQNVSREQLLSATAAEKERLAWYFENDGVTEHDLALYDEVMLDYWSRLMDCLSANQVETSLESCLHMLLR